MIGYCDCLNGNQAKTKNFLNSQNAFEVWNQVKLGTNREIFQEMALVSKNLSFYSKKRPLRIRSLNFLFIQWRKVAPSMEDFVIIFLFQIKSWRGNPALKIGTDKIFLLQTIYRTELKRASSHYFLFFCGSTIQNSWTRPLAAATRVHSHFLRACSIQ